MKSAFRPHFSRFSPFCSSSFSGGGSCELMFSTLPLASCRATFSAIESFSVDIFINGKTLSVRIELLDQESKFGQLIIVMICFGKTRFSSRPSNCLAVKFNSFTSCQQKLCIDLLHVTLLRRKKKRNIRGGGEGKVSSFPTSPPSSSIFLVCSLQRSRDISIGKRMQQRLTGLGG